MKSIDEYFIDWEGHVFGYGYGTGEPEVMAVLKSFMDAIGEDGRYDYQLLESACGSQQAWLMINALCKAGMFDWGTSVRYGWLEKRGKALHEYVRARTTEQMTDTLNGRPETYAECFPDHCNCDDGACIKANPFWQKI